MSQNMEDPFYTDHIPEGIEGAFSQSIYIPKNPETTLLHKVVRENWQTFITGIE